MAFTLLADKEAPSAQAWFFASSETYNVTPALWSQMRWFVRKEETPTREGVFVALFDDPESPPFLNHNETSVIQLYGSFRREQGEMREYLVLGKLRGSRVALTRDGIRNYRRQFGDEGFAGIRRGQYRLIDASNIWPAEMRRADDVDSLVFEELRQGEWVPDAPRQGPIIESAFPQRSTIEEAGFTPIVF